MLGVIIVQYMRTYYSVLKRLKRYSFEVLYDCLHLSLLVLSSAVYHVNKISVVVMDMVIAYNLTSKFLA